MDVHCPRCGKPNHFDQPYAYHVGFGDQGFLYNDAGDCTLVWSTLDPVYEDLLARHSPEPPGVLTGAAKREFEARLPPSPRGDRWRFVNTPRCTHCRAALTPPMGPDCIQYLVFPDSVLLGIRPFERSLQTYIEDCAAD